MLCQHHTLDLKLFCETCKDMVCDNCVVYGPHQTKNHKIISFNDAYEIRQSYIREKIEIQLKEKKEILLNQLQSLDQRMNDIKAQKEIITKDINMEYEGGILKRLDDALGTNISILQKEIAILQRFLNEIDEFIHTFEYLALSEDNILPLLFMSKTLKNQMMKLLSIIIKTEIKQHPADLPRELADLRIKLQNAKTVDQQIQFKKMAIWKCREDKIQSLKKIDKDFHNKMENEILHWVQLLKKVVITFDQLCLICTFCGCFMQQEIVNEDCKMNSKAFEEGFTQEEPKMKKFGNCQHFFGNPKKEHLTLKKDQYPNFGNYYEQKKAAKEIYLKVVRSLWFSVIDLKARKYLKQLDLKAIFKKYDPENQGTLTLVKFKYLLNRDLEMSVKETEALANFFKDEKDDKVQFQLQKIHYQYFLDVDWYIEQLRKLEDNLKLDLEKQGKLYGKRSTTVPTKMITEKTLPKKQQDKPFVYSSFTRFSQPPEEPPQIRQTQPKFGFAERSQIQNDRQERQQRTETAKSASVGSQRRVQFQEDQTISSSRFQESLPLGNYLQKFYH